MSIYGNLSIRSEAYHKQETHLLCLEDLAGSASTGSGIQFCQSASGTSAAPSFHSSTSPASFEANNSAANSLTKRESLKRMAKWIEGTDGNGSSNHYQCSLTFPRTRQWAIERCNEPCPLAAVSNSSQAGRPAPGLRLGIRRQGKWTKFI